MMTMCKWRSDRSKCVVADEEIAEARSALIGLRARLDHEGFQTVSGYGQAIAQVGSLIATTFGLAMAAALTGRGLDADQLDAVYRDLHNSVRRCRTFLGEGSPAHATAQNLVMACTLLGHLFRMRFHAVRAEGQQQRDADDAAEQIVGLVQTIFEMKRPGVQLDGEVRLAA